MNEQTCDMCGKKTNRWIGLRREAVNFTVYHCVNCLVGYVIEVHDEGVMPELITRNPIAISSK